MKNLRITSSCISCGMCVIDCPTDIIALEKGTPTLVAQYCIKCGHCEAVCQKNALHNEFLNHDSVLEITQNPPVDADTAELFLRSRRSIRCFREQIVPQQETEKLINIGRYAQTGSNAQGVTYLVVSNPATMASVKKLTMDFYKNQTNPTVQKMYKRFEQSDKDIIFRGAPMCILALTDKDIPYNKSCALYALTYIELFAPSLKLATCWAGFFERYTSTDSDELRQLLDIPAHLVVSGALLYGYPQFTYHRAPDRNPLAVEWR